MHKITAIASYRIQHRTSLVRRQRSRSERYTPGNEMDKFADDWCINVPAVNSSSRLADTKHAENWTSINNLKVNPTKYMEILFFDKRWESIAQPPPPPLPGIERVTSVKILGVTITNNMSVAEHVHTTITSCTQTLCSQSFTWPWNGRHCAANCFPLSSSTSCSMHQVSGGDSIQRKSDIALMHSFVVVHAVVFFHLTRRRFKLSAAQPTKNMTTSPFYNNCCRYRRKRRKLQSPPTQAQP